MFDQYGSSEDESPEKIAASGISGKRAETLAPPPRSHDEVQFLGITKWVKNLFSTDIYRNPPLKITLTRKFFENLHW